PSRSSNGSGTAFACLPFMRKTHFVLTEVSSSTAILGSRKGGIHRDENASVPMWDDLQVRLQLTAQLCAGLLPVPALLGGGRHLDLGRAARQHRRQAGQCLLQLLAQ